MYYLIFLTTDDSKLRLTVTSNPKVRMSAIASSAGQNLSVRYMIPYETRKLAESRRESFAKVFEDLSYQSYVLYSDDHITRYKTSWYKPEILEYLRFNEDEIKEKLETCYFCSHLATFSREEVFAR